MMLIELVKTLVGLGNVEVKTIASYHIETTSRFFFQCKLLIVIAGVFTSRSF